nr:O-antigen polymerase [Enterobacter chuandaensis]
MLPHSILFLIFNLTYILPVAYVHFFGFAEGGVEQIFDNDPDMLSSMIMFYAIALFFFIASSSLFGFGIKSKRIEWQVDFKLPWMIKLLFLAVLVSLLISKILLYPEGVYSAYAFDSGAMSSRVWNVSMGLSELGVVIFVFCLVTKNVRFASLTFVVVSLNLLHGTRIFTLILLLVIMFNVMFISKRFSKIKILLLMSVFFCVIVISFLMVFILRSNVAVSNLSLDLVISPLVYESLFNQISFIRMLDLLNQGVVPFAPHMLYVDSAIFTLPSFSDADKASQMYINNFGELSPLGGLSGYASAIIYFSNYFFLWYFILGGISSIFLRMIGNTNFKIFSRVVYIYFICDSLFRFNRDPWFIVIKMLSNNVVFLLFILILIAFKMRNEGRRVIQ